MNRIYIIGNGFDLSHGLPTSYQDFIEFLIKKEVFTFIDELLLKSKIIAKDLNHDFLGYLEITHKEMNRFFKEHNYYGKGEEEEAYFKNLKNEFYQEPLKTHKKYFKLNNKNELYKKILDSDHFLWGKIEIQYFELLKRYHEMINPDNNNIEIIKSLVKTLNNNLDYIKNELVFYLAHLQDNNKNDFKESELCLILNERINPKTSEIIRRKKEKKNLDINDKINQNLFLNFNYTDTYNYLRNKCNSQISIINIHGNIKNTKDVIFGFGDENTDEYKKIENSDDVFLENIKSFKYLKNNNYDNLIGFIERDFYEVYLLGHSCSVTDRVLLKKIFENPNCLTIKIIPRSGNDDVRFENYKEISFNIARNFEDNGMMRDKIISYKDCKNSLPNIDKIKVNVFDYIKFKK